MNSGYDNIVWIDTDILVLRDISKLFQLDNSIFVATEEAIDGRYKAHGGERTRRWGLEVGRSLPFALNSGVIRATTAHRGLLEHWRDLLEFEHYQEAQSLDWQNRPWHMLSDQDALTALVAAREYADIPLILLRRGTDIIQYFQMRGYTVVERISNIFSRGPMFVHSQGEKPWIYEWNKVAAVNLGQYLWKMYIDLSPYTLNARIYRSLVGSDTSWMKAHSWCSEFLRVTGLWYPPLVGFPLAILWDIREIVKKARVAMRSRR